MPVIYEVSYASKVRPERSMTVSAIAAQQSLVASPVAACTAALLGLLGSSGSNMTLGQIMMVTIPATLLAVLITSTVMSFYGKELDKDSEYLQRVKEGLVLPPKPIEHKELPKTAAWSPSSLFSASFSQWLPVSSPKPYSAHRKDHRYGYLPSDVHARSCFPDSCDLPSEREEST